MPIKSTLKNNKIRKERLNYVLMLLEIDYGSLRGCQLEIEHFKEELENLRSPRTLSQFPPDVVLDLHSNMKMRTILHQALFAQNAWDLFEFFYNEKATKPEYYYFHFPIDRGKFRKKRVPEKKFLRALRGMCRDNKTIVDLAEKNMKAFYGCMKVKLKQPTVESGNEIVDHYAKKIKDLLDKQEQEK